VSASTDPPVAEPPTVLPVDPSEEPATCATASGDPAAEPCEAPAEEPAPAEPAPETDEPALTGSLDEVWEQILDSEERPGGGQSLPDGAPPGS
jgi:hypothetical protein